MIASLGDRQAGREREREKENFDDDTLWTKERKGRM